MEKLSQSKTLVNLANSILNFYNCKTYHNSLKEIDEVLKNSKKDKICLMLFDGFGKAILERYKKYAPFMYQHRYLEISSVYPATTVAATTSVTTGRYPLETGYMGWVEYFKKYNKFIETFSSINRTDRKEQIIPNVTSNELKINTIWDDINEKHKQNIAINIMSFDYHSIFGIRASNKKWVKNVDNLLDTHKFVYAYNIYPDHLMHKYGVDNRHIKNIVIQINKMVEEFTKKHPDYLFIIISDHGMTNVQKLDIRQIDGFVETLSKPVAFLEGRFANFFVKNKKEFEKIYKNNEILHDNFKLLTKEEALKNNVFGYEKLSNQYSLDTIGDYLLIATNKYYIEDGLGGIEFKGHHAGITDDEMKIHLQIYNN